MAFAYAVFAQFLSLEVAALLEKKERFTVFVLVSDCVMHYEIDSTGVTRVDFDTFQKEL